MKIEIKCKVCNKVFYVWPYKKDTAKYCSDKCRWENQKGKTRSKETIDKMRKNSKPNKGSFKKGYHASPGTEFKKGNSPSSETRKKISLANKGKKHSEETKRKIREACKGEKCYNWKGGKTKNSEGYILILQHTHPRSDHRGYVKRSYLVMEKHINRFLKPKEIIHHINGVKNDDRLENLQLFKTSSEHSKHHHPKGSYWGNRKHLKTS